MHPTGLHAIAADHGLGTFALERRLPNLTDFLQIVGAIGLVAGGCIGFFLPASSGRQIAENVVLVAGVGAVVGAILGFAVWSGTAI